MMRWNSWRGALWVVSVAVSLGACSALQSGPGDELQDELNRRRRQWREQDVAAYSYTVRRLCFCTPEITTPVVVRVRGGSVQSRAYADSGVAVDEEHARFWPPVEGLFDVVQDAIDRDAESIAVEYHPQLGYPTSIRIDYEHNVADEELTLTATDLRPGG